MINSILFIECSQSPQNGLQHLISERFPHAEIETRHSSEHYQQYDLVCIDCTTMNEQQIRSFEQLRNIFPTRMVLVKPQTTSHSNHFSSLDNTLNPYQSLFPSLSQALSQTKTQDPISSAFFSSLKKTLDLRKSLQKQPIDIENWQPQSIIHSSPNSVVYLANARNAAQPSSQAVIKTFRYATDNTETLNSFIDAVSTLRHLNSPHIVTIYEAGVSHDTCYIVMEYLGSQTLKQVIESSLIPENQAQLQTTIDYFTSILAAINTLHQADLLHRDIKPSNIMVTEKESIVLVDCGIENNWLIETGQIEEDEVFCTPYYVSPERAACEPCTEQSEIYSLGVLLYEMITQEKPYEGNSLIDLIKAHALAPIPELPSIAAQYQPILNKLLAKHPDDRFQSIDEVFTAIETLH